MTTRHIPSLKHPLAQCTDSELSAYRAELEHQIAGHAPTAAVVDDLRALLLDCLREQDSRRRIRHSR